MSNEILDALKGDNTTEETQADTAPKTDPNNEKIDRLENTILGNQSLINQLSGKLDTMASLLASKKEEKETPDYDDDDDLTPAQVLEIARRERKEDGEKQNLAQRQATWDNKTDADFGPFGFTDKSSKFYREVHTEYSLNGDKKAATGVYDAAVRVFARGVRDGWIKGNALETAKRNHAIANGTLEGGLQGRKTTKNDKETSEIQNYFGKKLGFTQDKVNKIYNNGGTA